MFKYIPFVFALCFSSASFAASNARVVSIARPANVVNYAGKTAIDVVAKGYAANDPYKISRAFLNKSMMRSVLRIGGYGLAIQAAVAAFGYFYDDLQNEFFRIDKVGQCQMDYVGILGEKVSVSGCVGLMIAHIRQTYDVTGHTYTVTSNSESAILFTVNYTYQYVRPNGEIGTGNSYAKGGVVALEEGERVPIDDVDFNGAFESAFANAANQNDINALTDLLSNGNGLAQDAFESVEYDVTQTDDYQRAKDLIQAGTYQTTDPNGENYIDPDLAAQVEADLARTSEEDVEDLNQELEQPLTQTQLEETLENGLPDLDTALDSTLSEYEQTMAMVMDKTNDFDGLPTDFVDLTNYLPNYQSCQSMSFSFMGSTIEFPGERCPEFEKIKQGIGWILSLVVAFVLFRDATKEAN